MSSSSPSRSSEIRRDPVLDRWVIFSPSRSRRPSDIKSHSPSPNPNPNPNPPPSCPFCVGGEKDCGPEIFRLPSVGDDAACGWRVKVIENLYPALRRDLEPESLGSDGMMPTGRCAWRGFGFHDVVIETPDHEARLWDLDAEGVTDVVLAYKEQVERLARNGAVKYVQVFKNYGASAGASMNHSHSQIIGLPLVPPTVTARMNSMKEHFDKTGECSLCEARTEDLLINESTHFFSVVPFAGSHPFEIWIIPRDHSCCFHEIDKEKALDFSGLLKLMLLKLSRELNDPPFNFMIHSAPFELQPSAFPYTHWFLQIVPELNVFGGFEIGSGCYINTVFPEDAVKVLHGVSN